MKIHLAYWIIAYIGGIVVCWGNIYSMTFLAIMWGACVIGYSQVDSKFAEDMNSAQEEKDAN